MIEMFKLLADSNRFKIFTMLLYDEFCVCDIERFLHLKQANVSKHLKFFKDMSLLKTRHEGKWVHYGLANNTMKTYRDLISQIKKDSVCIELMNELKKFDKSQCHR